MRFFVPLLSLLGCASGPESIVRKSYAKPYEVSAFTGYALDGLTLFHVLGPSADDRNGDSFIVGVDGKGTLVRGAPLFTRAIGGVTPSVMAKRAFDILLARAGGEPLAPGPKTTELYTKEEWALIAEPVVKDGVLTFWYIEGEMRPQVTRGELVIATGAFTRRSAEHVLHPPEAAIPGIRAKLQSDDVATVKKGLLEVSEWKVLAPDVEALLSHADRQVRSMAIGILGNLGEPRSIARLIQMLADGPEWGDRSLAGQALVTRWKTKEAIDAVRARVANGGNGQEISVLREVLADYDKQK